MGSMPDWRMFRQASADKIINTKIDYYLVMSHTQSILRILSSYCTSLYLGGLWQQFADDIKTVDVKNLSQDLNNSLKKLVKATGWDSVADVVQYTCQ